MYERLFQISHIYTSSTNMWARAEYERWAEEADIGTEKKAPDTLMKQNESGEPLVGDQQKKKGGESGSGIGSEKEKDDGGKL